MNQIAEDLTRLTVTCRLHGEPSVIRFVLKQISDFSVTHGRELNGMYFLKSFTTPQSFMVFLDIYIKNGCAWAFTFKFMIIALESLM